VLGIDADGVHGGVEVAEDVMRSFISRAAAEAERGSGSV
jgi:hypothetical protein